MFNVFQSVLFDGSLHGFLHEGSTPRVRVVLQQHNIHGVLTFPWQAVIQHLVGDHHHNQHSQVKQTVWAAHIDPRDFPFSFLFPCLVSSTLVNYISKQCVYRRSLHSSTRTDPLHWWHESKDKSKKGSSVTKQKSHRLLIRCQASRTQVKIDVCLRSSFSKHKRKKLNKKNKQHSLRSSCSLGESLRSIILHLGTGWSTCPPYVNEQLWSDSRCTS